MGKGGDLDYIVKESYPIAIVACVRKIKQILISSDTSETEQINSVPYVHGNEI